MIWVVLVVLAVAAAALLTRHVGSNLPTEHSVSRVALFNRPPEEVWRVITDFANQASWRPDLLRVERLPARRGRQLWCETDTRGQTVTIETVEYMSPRRLVRQIADPHPSFSVRWTLEVGEYGEVTSLTVTEDGGFQNPYLRFISRFIVGHTSAVDQYLKALGRKLGVDVTVRGL